MHRLYVVASLIALSLGLYWPKLFSTFKSQHSLATVVSVKGTAELISRDHRATRSPQKMTLLQMNESITTGTDGDLVLRFKRGAEIRLLPSTFITLLRKANSTLIALRRGEIQIINEGEINSIFITEGGQEQNLRDYQGTSEPTSLWIDPQAKTLTSNIEMSTEALPLAFEKTSPKPSPSVDSREPLLISQDPLAALTPNRIKDYETQLRIMISNQVEKQKNHLYRCYSALVQNNEEARGKIQLHFTVNNYGKVEDPMVVTTEIKDARFEKCLLQILKRTNFQPFQGQKISTYLPLRFEKHLSL